MPMGKDGRLARIYLKAGTDRKRLVAEGSDKVMWARVVSDMPILDVLRDPDGHVQVPLVDTDARIAVHDGDTDLLAGRDVILGHCNGETAEVLFDWLVWHRQHHRATGALIIERGQSGDADRKAEDLRNLLAQDPRVSEELAAMRIVIVDFEYPLGDAAKGAETHPMNAPDAPGKERMTPPEPDIWHSPLSYNLTYDLLQHGFLSDAASVANLEVIDLVAPLPDDRTMFDHVQQAPMGMVKLRGTKAYPWSVRKNADPAFSDHICLRFDDPTAEWRWCVAPDKLPAKRIWLQDRLLGMKVQGDALPFWRFMALRYGRGDDIGVGRIVPKTSLIEDATLLEMAEGADAKPLRQPTEVPAEARVNDHGEALGNRVAIVTTMKNEGPFILEWIAYHRAIGIKDFLVYTNDCTDGTDGFLQLLERKGLCQWRENPYRDGHMKPQHAALNAANSEEMVKKADWAICMDVDEFIAVHTGDGKMKDLFAAVPDANLISLTWRLFGNADIDKYEDTFITQKFTQCAAEFCNRPHQAWGFKTLFRNIGLFRKMGVHRPKGLLPTAVDRINWINGSGKQLPKDQWRTAWRSHSGTYGYDLVTLNHYAVRSAESFLVKRDRGRVNHVDRDQGMAYWFRMNHNVKRDARMTRMKDALQTEYDRLLADPDIRAAHEACVAAHKAKIAELKQQPKYKEFYAELTNERTRRLSRLHGHFGSHVYLAGPQVIPDEIAMRDPESEFFFTVEYQGEIHH